jgi:hypothetical protein
MELIAAVKCFMIHDPGLQYKVARPNEILDVQIEFAAGILKMSQNILTKVFLVSYEFLTFFL